MGSPLQMDGESLACKDRKGRLLLVQLEELEGTRNWPQSNSASQPNMPKLKTYLQP